MIMLEPKKSAKRSRIAERMQDAYFEFLPPKEKETNEDKSKLRFSEKVEVLDEPSKRPF